MPLRPLLFHCLEQQNLADFKELLDYDVDWDQYVVHACALQKDQSFLFELLERGWPIDHPLKNGRIPSLLCLTVERPALLEQLLQRGASPNTISNGAEMALSTAALYGSRQTIERLLEAGADVQIGEILHYAVECKTGDELEIIRLFLGRQAPVNGIQFAHPAGWRFRHHILRGTPLHKACSLGKHDLARLLLANGADPNAMRVEFSQM